MKRGQSRGKRKTYRPTDSTRTDPSREATHERQSKSREETGNLLKPREVTSDGLFFQVEKSETVGIPSTTTTPRFPVSLFNTPREAINKVCCCLKSYKSVFYEYSAEMCRRNH